MTGYTSRSDHTFVAWLARHEREQSPVGDIAHDVRGDLDDGCLAADAQTSDAVRAHLREVHGADDEVLEALSLAARRYLQGDRRGDALRAWAAGSLPLEAAVELLISACGGRLLDGPWVRHGSEHHLWFDTEVAATEGSLSGGERRVLAIAASLASGDHPVDLGDVLTGLDPVNLALVLSAFEHAAGGCG